MALGNHTKIALPILAAFLVAVPAFHVGSAGATPSISIEPASGPVGATLVITGSTLADPVEVRIGGLSSEFRVGDDGGLVATVPAGAVTGSVEVDTAVGTLSSATPFTVLPNIVFILTDDQRWDTLSVMPRVTERLIGHGVTFSNALVTNPSCCPSRATMLTGRYSHGTGVWTNVPPYGGFAAFDDGTTIATVLDDAGYATGLFGKYLNGYQWTDGSYVPPGWDRWRAFAPGGYYGYGLTLDGQGIEKHRSRPHDYSTDVLAEQVEGFIRAASPQDPVFVWLALRAPHEPPEPAPRHIDAFDGLAPWRPASYMEADVSDKPRHVSSRRRLWGDARIELDSFRQRQLETLLAVDEATGRVLRTLSDTGRLADTLIVYASDNGMLWGEHRMRGKGAPYEESIRVPLVIRWDRVIDADRTEPTLVANIDLPGTFAAAAGTIVPGDEGSSLLPLLDGPVGALRSGLLLEHQGDGVPSFCGLRTRDAVFVHYATGEEEYYRLVTDPYQLENLAGDPTWQPRIDVLRAETRERCNPLPPEMAPF